MLSARIDHVRGAPGWIPSSRGSEIFEMANRKRLSMRGRRTALVARVLRIPHVPVAEKAYAPGRGPGLQVGNVGSTPTRDTTYGCYADKGEAAKEPTLLCTCSSMDRERSATDREVGGSNPSVGATGTPLMSEA